MANKPQKFHAFPFFLLVEKHPWENHLITFLSHHTYRTFSLLTLGSFSSATEQILNTSQEQSRADQGLHIATQTLHMQSMCTNPVQQHADSYTLPLGAPSCLPLECFYDQHRAHTCSEQGSSAPRTKKLTQTETVPMQPPTAGEPRSA